MCNIVTVMTNNNFFFHRHLNFSCVFFPSFVNYYCIPTDGSVFLYLFIFFSSFFWGVTFGVSESGCDAHPPPPRPPLSHPLLFPPFLLLPSSCTPNLTNLPLSFLSPSIPLCPPFYSLLSLAQFYSPSLLPSSSSSPPILRHYIPSPLPT